MTGKLKPPAQAAHRPKVPDRQSPAPNTVPPPDSRWQRTVRYGWDKGGARGGRK